jgi:hypothetical protein
LTKNIPSFNFRYNACHSSNLNGYNYGPGTTPFAIGIVWYSFTGYNESLETVEMAIKGKINLFVLFITFVNLVITKVSWY